MSSSNSEEAAPNVSDEDGEDFNPKHFENSSNESENQEPSDLDSDDEPLIPSIFVKVEVEEVDPDEDEIKFDEHNNISPRVTRQRRIPRVSPPPKKRRRVMQCPNCNEEFETVALLRQHSIKHQVETRHKCEECGKCFSKAFGLRTHMRMHSDKSFRCPVCDVKFTSKANYERHMSNHDKNERCDKCNNLYHTKQQLESHIKRIHGRPVWKTMLAESKDKEPDSSNTSPNETLNDSFKVKIKREADSSQPSASSQNDGETDEDDDVPKNNGNGYLRRDELTYPTQCAIVNKMHKGRSVQDICQLYNITPEVVNEIWEEREEFSIIKKNGKTSMKYMNKILDSRILDWFNIQKSQGVQVTGRMLMDVAESFAKEGGFVAFNGSKKWLDRFKTRYSITFRPPNNRREYNNNPLDSKWRKQFLEEQWLDARIGIADEDIYTADEVGVYYNPSRGRIKKMSGKKYIHGYAKDRLAIFMCTNFNGGDKKKLLVCGTEDPLLRSCRSPETLPVTYIRHAQAHFTTAMFEEYVKYWNRELQSRNKKAILILDRATIHSKLTLSHLKLVFVPWKAANSLMPMKNGIFNKFRDEFRKIVLEDKTFNAIRGVDRNLTCLEALTMLEKAWERTPPTVIAKCFEITGYEMKVNKPIEDPVVPKLTENDDEMLVKMLEEYDVEPYFSDLTNLDNYLTVDEELLTGQGTNSSVFGGNHKSVDPGVQHQKDLEELLPLATERSESDEVEISVRKTRALQDLEIVRLFLQTNYTSYDVYNSFLDVEKFLMRQPINL